MTEIQTREIIKKIGNKQPVFIVAEMSGNHNKDFNRAIKLIDAACDAGVDAIKLQTYTPDTITIDSDNSYFQVKVNEAWVGNTLYNLYKKAYTPWEWQPKLKEYAEKKGVLLFSTPFDTTAVDFLEKMDVKLYKVASFEVVDIPLLKRVGQTKKPVIMSRGMASVEEIELAMKTLKEGGCPSITLLHCVSSYPTKPEEMNLATIPDMVKRFGVVAGLSDHTPGTIVSVAATALGACVVEKHFTLSRDDGGPDAAFSLEPGELTQLVKSIREVESAIGKPSYGAGAKESENVVFRKSLFVVKDIRAGEKITEENVRCIRPGYGLAPKFLKDILGKTAAREIKKGTPLSWNLMENNLIVKMSDREDSKKIWEIRNHPIIRKNFNNTNEILFADHDEWYKNQYFKNINNACFVLVNRGELVGYCRFDLKNNKYTVSIAIDTNNQGKGLGQYLLSGSLKKFVTEKDIFAEIKKHNTSSTKLFIRNNFKIYKKSRDNYYLKCISKK